VMVVAPWMQKHLGFNTGANALNASLILAVMALPTIISVAEDALSAIGRKTREASYALGATRAETIVKVVIPAAHSGIVAAVILGMMRAIGETMVLWACALQWQDLGSIVFLCFVADDAAFDHVDDVFGDVGGVVGDAFEVARNAEQVNEALDSFRPGEDALLDHVIHVFVQGVDFVIAAANVVSQGTVEVDQCGDAVAEHGLRFFGH